MKRYKKIFNEGNALFSKAVKLNSKNGFRDNQVNGAETFGGKLGMRPEVIWQWAIDHDYNLTLNGHLIMKDTHGFIDAVLSDTDF